MNSQVVFALAIHNHQPVGNFPHVFEEAYARSYLPLLRLLDRHPRIRLALHYSGPLLDWLQGAHPEFFPLLRGLVRRGQVEVMTGGYYEPILVSIPERDQVGQIRKMTTELERRFGARPRGLWLAERVWEPHLAGTLAAAGVEYTVVDDTHFLAAGLSADDLTGYFVTEEGGATLKVFPSLRALRYLIPWKPVAEVVAFLRSKASPSGPLLLMGDDGEKFGLWPGTYAHCWEAGWMEEFFTALEEEAEWLAVLPPGEAADGPPAGRVYLPTAAYDEMEEWALPAETGIAYRQARRRLEEERHPALRFVRGGFWRQFLVKYPEVNTLHKKMLRVSEKVWRIPPGRRRRRALEELWQAQCNCPYWHGVFGGVYLPHIRRANFAHLIAAEALADEHLGAGPRVQVGDLDADGGPEVEISTPSMVLWVDPAEGAGVVTWDWRAARVNLVDVLGRRREAYHAQLLAAPGETAAPAAVETIHTERVRVKEPHLERLLVYDRYRRAAFLDHLLPAGATLEAWAAEEFPVPFAGQPYLADPPAGPSAAVSCRREATVRTDGGTAAARIEKRFRADGAAARLQVRYRVTNVGTAALRALFGVETNWAVSEGSTIGIGGSAAGVAQRRTIQDADVIEVTDPGWPGPVRCSFPPATVWQWPIETVSNSEGGFERTFQGLTCVTLWPLSLAPGETREIAIDATLGDLAGREVPR
ncbi:MAG: DUF1926 domain-containing protein [Armatimonadota bacterium]|nr:DUF1926 domain-containing protein [Armatimonadota bacterium]MDR7494559.1 DUF1926 domain-containing protein [Armatimonadota bacterium]MDR7504474.1 DUF1926 domain-containing protein [Armatimonadota bacterium]MDR7553415.1 DUF1926 domain-containing protein [Armatimonadota bacterium]MDR7558391.1 DUF1926 domain-containing protein [Armatimonadota bacterium]